MGKTQNISVPVNSAKKEFLCIKENLCSSLLFLKHTSIKRNFGNGDVRTEDLQPLRGEGADGVLINAFMCRLRASPARLTNMNNATFLWEIASRISSVYQS